MGTPYLSEIRIVSFNFAPKGWAFCNGQTLAISQNQALFALLGTTYGGNGQTTFALPDLRGRIPLHMGNGHSLGERAGEENHTLLLSEMPAHSHPVTASASDANSGTPTADWWATIGNFSGYAPGPNTAMSAAALPTTAGGSQSHQNLAPLLTLTFIIALQGIFPSQN